MFDVGFWELAIIGVVALIIVGPERLPSLARTVGLWVGKGRRMVSDVKRDIDRELKASEVADLTSVKTEFDKVKKQVGNAKDTLVKDTGVEEITSTIKDTVDETSPIKEDITSGLDEIDQVANEVSEELEQAQPAKDQEAKVATSDSNLKSAPDSKK
jgi:sec-independent protein translocase protein TatB